MSVKKPSPGGSDYRVFQDVQRHTCIRVSCQKTGVWYIPMDTTLDLKQLTHLEFEKLYIIELKDYPVKKAAASYLGATWLGATPEARRHLEYLSGKVFKETATPLIFNDKETIMTDEAKEAVAAAKASIAKKAAPKKEAAPKAEAPAKAKGGKVAAPAPKAEGKAAPKKVAAPKDDAPSGRTRTSKEAGMKIKVLEKNPAVRAGSNREAQYKVLLACKTTDEAGEKLRAVSDKPWDLVRLAVSAGVIELY